MTPVPTFRGETARAFAEKANEQLATWVNDLASGNARTLDEYRHRAGKIAGLRLALDFLREAERKVLRLEDGEN